MSDSHIYHTFYILYIFFNFLHSDFHLLYLSKPPTVNRVWWFVVVMSELYFVTDEQVCHQ